MQPYFDLHLHVSLKSYLTHIRPDKRMSCWDFIPSAFGLLRSQASLEQCRAGGLQLAVVPFYPVERPMSTAFIIRHIATHITPLDGRMLDVSTESNYFDHIQAELDHLKASGAMGADRSFKIVNSLREVNQTGLNFMLAIEGAHALEKFNTDVRDNLRQLKAGPYRFLYLTLTHLTRYPVSTHAYGLKLIKNNVAFKPEGFGLRQLGKDIIDIAYDNADGRRVFIDIKHMSLVSRRHFYEYRREKGYTDVPILATHLGVTGLSWAPEAIAKQFSRNPIRHDDVVEVFYDRPAGIGRGPFWRQTHFNPWSVNLYDEEIVEIVQSGGLIGLNLDQRILGANKVSGEFFSSDELRYIMSGYKDAPAPEIQEGEFVEEPEEEALADEARAFNETRHLRHLCNTILHIVKTGGEEAWNCLCLGSDLDGLIDPINNCQSVAEFPKLEADLLHMLPEMMDEDERHNYNREALKEKVRGIMYGNAVAWLQRHF